MSSSETACRLEVAADAEVKIRRYLRFLGCPADSVDDLTQETLLAALQRREPAPLPWLLAVARNQLRKALRDRGRKREVADIDRLRAIRRNLIIPKKRLCSTCSMLRTARAFR